MYVDDCSISELSIGEMSFHKIVSTLDAQSNGIQIPKKIATVTLFGCIHVTIDDTMSSFVKPTPAQIKNLHDTFCIDVELFDEE
jgi:hypothetical protein